MRSIRNQTYKNFEIIVIDNNSTDSTVEIIKREYPEVRLVEAAFNHGFAYSNNLGAKKANGEILVFLNPDVFFGENFLADMLDFKLREDAQIVGPKILDFHGKSHYGGELLSIDAYGYAGYNKEPFYVEGCALMIDKLDFKRIGEFDEKYFMYSEDIDLCWRALMFGMKIEVCDKVVVHHYGGGSSQNTSLFKEQTHVVPYVRRYEVEKNNLRNLLKNYKLVNLLWTLPIFLLTSFFEGIFYVLIGNGKATKFLAKALIWNIRNMQDTLRARFWLQSSRVVGDFKIMAKMSGIIPNKLFGLLIVGTPRFK